MSKVREFWILDDSRVFPNPTKQMAYMSPPEVLFPLIHVIEMSAYQALEARHKKLLETLRNLKHLNHHTIDEELWRIDQAIAEDEKSGLIDA